MIDRLTDQWQRPYGTQTDGRHDVPTENTYLTALSLTGRAQTDHTMPTSCFPMGNATPEGRDDRFTDRLAIDSGRTTLLVYGRQDAPTNKSGSMAFLQKDNTTHRSRVLTERSFKWTMHRPTDRPTTPSKQRVY